MSKHTINENIVYQAVPHKATVMNYMTGAVMENLFDTNKFEPFKVCCGQCFYLGNTKTIVADRNVKGCERNMWAACCPNRLRRMEHYCGNCGLMLAVADIPDTPTCAMCAPKPEWSRIIPEVEKFKLTLKNLGGQISVENDE